MNVLGLFDGMSCGRLALDRAGIKYDKYFASEVDKHAIKVAMHNHPDTVQIGDVCDVRGADLPKIDLLLGGSPCQGFSSAGKMINFEDPRSRLFFEFVRLKNECQPTHFLLENVPMKKAWRDIITQHLGVEPICINSARVSAQNRIRWYWTNIRAEQYDLFGAMRPTIGQPPDRGITLRDILQDEKDVPTKCVLSDAAVERILRRNWSAAKVDPDKTGTLNTTNNSGRLSIDSGTTLITLPRGDFGGQFAHADKCSTVTSASWKDNNFLKLNLNKVGSLYRRLTPIEAERLQTVPDNYTACVSDTQRYRMLGNGWTVDVIAWILSHI